KQRSANERLTVVEFRRVLFRSEGAVGEAEDDNGNGLDEVPTLMTLLQLNGNSSMGPVSIGLDPSNPTTGQIEEKVNGTPGVLDQIGRASGRERVSNSGVRASGN